MDNYYDSPLHWSNVEVGKAYVEKYSGDVVRILKKSESDYDEYIHIQSFDLYENKLKKRKLTEEGWLMIGYADWEYVEIPFNQFNRAVIRSYVKKYMDPFDYDKTYI